MTSSSPSISVVIPCFNSRAWVSQAIDSVLAQQEVSVDIVVVDDGSNDGSHEVLESYGSRIKIIHQENSGVSKARQVGAAHASGDYVKFLDADDLVPAGILRTFLDVASKYPGEALIGRSQEVGSAGEILSETMYNIGYRPAHLAPVKPEFLLTQATSSGLWFLPRRSMPWNNLLDHRLSMGEEYKFCMGIIKSGIPIRFVNHLAQQARVHDSPSRLSRSRDEQRHLTQIRLIEESVAFIQSEIHDYSEAAIRTIARTCWSRGRHCLRIGCFEAAGEYFLLAHATDPDVKPVGSVAYRTMCAITGPGMAEKALQLAKSFLRKNAAT